MIFPKKRIIITAVSKMKTEVGRYNPECEVEIIQSNNIDVKDKVVLILGTGGQ